MAVVAIIIKMASGKTIVNLGEIMTEPTYSGYDTVGTASGGGISEDKFLEKYEDVIEYTDNVDSSSSNSDIEVYFYKALGMSAASALYNIYISSNITIDTVSDLSNGDTVTYTFDFTETELEEIEKYFNVRLKYNEDGISYTVSGLEEIKIIDVFANLDVTYDGIAPDAYISSITNSTYSYVEYECTPSSELDNGSTVTISISDSVAEYLAENYGYIPSSTSTEITVEGLEELKTVDAFADIDIIYSGIAPNAYISSVTNSTYSYIEYEYTPSSELDNGSTVTISISDSVVEYLAENYGYIPSSTSTEITVEGLDSYVTSLSEIPDETMEKLKSQSEDVIDSYVANNWVDYVTVEDKTFMGCYFLTPKDISDLDSSYWGTSSSTYIYMIYKLNIHEYVKGELDNTFEYYYFVKYTNPIILADGTCSIDLSAYETADGYGDDSSSFRRVIVLPPT